MADIKVTSAFIEDVITDRDGTPFALRTSEPHRRKNDAGEWETTARTFRTIRASRDSGIRLTNYVKGDRVQFEGTEKTEKRDKDGKTYYDLVVWVSSLTVIGGGGPRNDNTAAPAASDAWSTAPVPDSQSWEGGDYGDDLPF